MTVEGINGIGVSQTGSFETNGNANADVYTKGIQKQIEDAQQRLQNLSSNEELSIEDKMKKRQEIQKEIQKLNQELRQHQMEKRKEQQKQTSTDSDSALPETEKLDEEEAGISKESMKAVISADTSMLQAAVHRNVATSMNGRARVLETEIKQDAGRGASTEKKEAELADIQEKASKATSAQASSLSEASKNILEASREKTSGNGKESDSSKNNDKDVSVKNSYHVYKKIDEVSKKTSKKKFDFLA